MTNVNNRLPKPNEGIGMTNRIKIPATNPSGSTDMISKAITSNNYLDPSFVKTFRQAFDNLASTSDKVPNGVCTNGTAIPAEPSDGNSDKVICLEEDPLMRMI